MQLLLLATLVPSFLLSRLSVDCSLFEKDVHLIYDMNLQELQDYLEGVETTNKILAREGKSLLSLVPNNARGSNRAGQSSTDQKRTLPAGTGGSEDAMALIDHSQLEAVARRISSNKARKLVAVMTAVCFAPTAIGTIIGDRPVVTRLATQNVSAPSRRPEH